MLNYYQNDCSPINTVSPSISIPGQLGTEFRPLYNSNISSMAVNIDKFQSPLVYNYKYDQLNRLVNVNAYNSNNENWFSLTAANDYREVLSYDANGNILGYQRNGAGASQNLNNYSYTYTANTNRLARISNSVNASNATYGYDAIGNVTKDDKQNVAVNNWNLYGKLQSVQKTDGTNITYTYDAAGNRISKTVGNVTEWYVRDASGNIMSIYTAGDNSINSGHLTLSEVHKYGSSRLGMLKPNIDLTLTQNNTISLPGGTTGYTCNFTRGSTEYELTDARGNILVTLSDKKQLHTSDNLTVDYYLPDIITAQQYSSFGAISISFNSSNLKQAFNGQRRSTEISPTTQTAMFWEYNGDIGIRWNLDPVPKTTVSPYVVLGNNPIMYVDPMGNDWYRKDGKTFFNEARHGKRKGYEWMGKSFTENGMSYGSDGNASQVLEGVSVKSNKPGKKRETDPFRAAFNGSFSAFNVTAAEEASYKVSQDNFRKGNYSAISPEQLKMYKQWEQADKDYRTLSYIFVGGIAAPVAAIAAVESGAGYYIYQGGSWVVRSYGKRFAINLGKQLAANRFDPTKIDLFDVTLSTVNPLQKLGLAGRYGTDLINASFDFKGGNFTSVFGEKSIKLFALDAANGAMRSTFKYALGSSNGDPSDIAIDVYGGLTKGAIKEALHIK